MSLDLKAEFMKEFSGNTESVTSESSNQQATQSAVDDVKENQSVQSPQVEASGHSLTEAESETDSETSEEVKLENADTSTDETKTVEAKEKSTSPKTVPAAALYEEREKRKELSSKLKSMELQLSEHKKVIELAKREMDDRQARLEHFQKLIDEGKLDEVKQKRVVPDANEIKLKKLEMEQELKEHLEKVRKEKEEEITKTVREEKMVEAARQLDIVCDGLVKKYPYVEKEEILTAMAYNPKFKGQLPAVIAKTINDERAKKFGSKVNGSNQPNHPKTAATQTASKTAQDKGLFTPDAEGARNFFRSLGKG